MACDTSTCASDPNGVSGRQRPRVNVTRILRAFGIPCWATYLHRKCGIADCTQFRNATILSEDHDASCMGREASVRRVVFSSIGDLNPIRGEMRALPPGKAQAVPLPPGKSKERQPEQRLQGPRRSTLLISSLGYTISSLFSVFFPSDCRICSLPLINISRLPVCPECLEGVNRFQSPTCAVCGERMFGFATQDTEQLCGECLKKHPAFEKAAAYGSYDGGLRELIHLLKYDRVRSAASLLGRMLAEAAVDLMPEFEASEALLIPVPLHSGKLRSRGFNQSELIAEAALKSSTGLRGMKLRPRLLRRVRATESQTGLTRKQRRDNVRGAFAMTNADEVRGRDILLVDDVLTTGTTVGECARVLRKAGAARVWVATVARVMKPEMTSATMPEPEPEEALTMSAHAG
jgi:ComF family protein